MLARNANRLESLPVETQQLWAERGLVRRTGRRMGEGGLRESVADRYWWQEKRKNSALRGTIML